MNAHTHMLIQALREPSWAATRSENEWDVLIRLARRAGVLGRLAHLLETVDGGARVPTAAGRHLDAARILAEQLDRVVRWEVNRIQAALHAVDVPLVLLKGAAYMIAGLPPARGRLVSDVDVLVPRDRIEQVEGTLLDSGWESSPLDAYDQRYYRQWMHEIPPMRHRVRQTVLDLHHTILPETARLHPDPAKLFAAAVPIEGNRSFNYDAARRPQVRMFCPTDLVLHSATHLFQDGEYDSAIRDLADLDDLLRLYGAEPGFWDALPSRAKDLDLHRPLWYALRFTAKLFHTPVPARVLDELRFAEPSGLVQGLMGRLIPAALAPDPGDVAPLTVGLARWMLFARGHYLRMPLRLLLPHLARKSWRRL